MPQSSRGVSRIAILLLAVGLLVAGGTTTARADCDESALEFLELIIESANVSDGARHSMLAHVGAAKAACYRGQGHVVANVLEAMVQAIDGRLSNENLENPERVNLTSIRDFADMVASNI